MSWITVIWSMVALGAGHQSVRTDPTYRIDTWETEDGLPSNSATAMVQTPDGYLWFGTFNGLVRFDGVKFTVFNRASTPQLPNAGIVNLHLDQRGWLWVSTLQGMAVLAQNQWRAFGTNEGWAGNYVRTFVERHNGDLLLTTFDGKVLEFADGRLGQLPEPPGEPGKGYLGHVDETGQWWVAQHQFVGRWDGQRWVQMVAVTDAASDKVGLAAARDGGMWLLLTNELRKYRGGTEVSRVQLPELLGGLWSMFEDSRSNLWICTTDRGIYQVSPDGEVRRWTTTNGLSSDSTRFVFEDRENNLWVGTSAGGIQRFKLKRFHSFGAERRESQQVVSSVSASAAGDVWIATYGQGLFRRSGSELTTVALPQANEVTRFLQSVLEDRAGRVWVGTYLRGLWLLDKERPRVISTGETGGDNITVLFEDSRGRIWMAGGETASVHDGGKFRVFGAQDGLPRGVILCFAEDSSGAVWLAHQDGVFRFERDRFTLMDDDTGLLLPDITCLRADAHGAMWMGSLTRALVRWRDGKFATVGAAAGLPVRAIYSIIEDRHGIWWMASDGGVVRASLADLHAAADNPAARVRCQILDASDGLPGKDFSTDRQPVSARDAAGKLWFAMSKGVAMIDPTEFRLNTNPPPVQIEKLSYRAPATRGARQPGHVAAAPNEIDVHLSSPFTEPLRLPPGSRQIEIHYTALSLSAPEKVRFQTQLQGTGHGWEEPYDRRVTRFYEPPPGDYLFRVRAANNDGTWNETGASLAFVVEPFLWQTGWFRVVVALLLASSGGGSVWLWARARLRRAVEAHRQRNELAHVGRMSTMGQLASSLAHELNQPLGAILRNAEAAERFLQNDPPDLEEVRAILADIRKDDQRAGDVIDRMRALLKRRGLERTTLDISELVHEVVPLVQHDAVSRGVRLEIEAPRNLPPVCGDRVQLQQVLLNLILNGMDAMVEVPAYARRLVVRARQADAGTIEVAVADAGHGVPAEKLTRLFEPFFTTKPNGMGLGLPISYTIIAAHGGRIWAENSTAGATFFFTVPVTPDRVES